MMKQYRMQPGTSPRIYYVLTVMDDETMTLTFHGTDREMTEVVTTCEDGWIVTPRGGLYPPVGHSRWQDIDPAINQRPDPARNQRSAAADNHHDTDTAQPLPSHAREGSGVGSHTSLWPAVAAFAAACVALVVVYESGLLIPVGLIGVVAGGILR